jgi:hypothetical protein
MTAPFVVHMNPRKPRVYLSGPMSGVPNLNRVTFDHAAEEVYFGWEAEPINPHLLHEGESDTSWRGFMIRDVAHLLQADRIYMLRGWWWSKGARWEWLIACFLMRLPVVYQGGVLGGAKR